MISNSRLNKKHAKNDAVYIGIGIGASIFVLGIALFCFIKFWPVSEAENKQRLLDVANMCNKNEDSRECKKMAQDYGITVEYCHALYDIPTLYGEIPIYMIARLKDFEPETPNYNKYINNYYKRDQIDTSNWYPYYGCADTLDEARSLSGLDKLSGQGRAIKSLANIPQFSVSGNRRECTLYSPKKFDNIWSWIPDAKDLWNDWESFRTTHKSCGQLEEIRQKTNEITKVLNAYAHNYTVQLYYESYDKSNGGAFNTVWLINNMTNHVPDSSITDFAQVMSQLKDNRSFVVKKAL